jgi:hypothetical protein
MCMCLFVDVYANTRLRKLMCRAWKYWGMGRKLLDIYKNSTMTIE